MASLICFNIDVIHGNKMNSNVPIFSTGARNFHGKNERKITLSKKPLINRGRKSFRRRQRGWLLKGKSSKSEASEEKENSPALETVMKLHDALKNQNIQEVSNTIGEECTCVCNFFSFFHFFRGKQQVLKFFKNVMEFLGKNIEFVVQPTLQDGMNIGVSWKLEWCKTHVPLGKGFSLYICQIYQGKVLIRNVEMFMEPIIHIRPFRMNLIAYLMCIMETWCGELPREKLKKTILALILLAIILFFLKPGLY